MVLKVVTLDKENWKLAVWFLNAAPEATFQGIASDQSGLEYLNGD
jgi:hypothetical protein